MKNPILAFATIFAVASTPALASSVSLPASSLSAMGLQAFQDAQVVKIKDDKGKGQKAANKGKKDKPQKANNNNKAQKANNPGNKEAKKAEQAMKNKPNKTLDKTEVKVRRSKEDRVRLSNEILRVPAPEGRDMSVLLGTAPLALLGSTILFPNVSDEQLLTYRNCPPGLAKKDPPCVPPGLAKQGVTYDEWVSYDKDRLDEIYLDQRGEYLDPDMVLDDSNLLLSSDQIASLFGLRPTSSGNRYALIDGQPVLLTNEDYRSLLRINDLARVQTLPAGLRVAPTAALSQRELRQTYNVNAGLKPHQLPEQKCATWQDLAGVKLRHFVGYRVVHGPARRSAPTERRSCAGLWSNRSAVSAL